MQLHGIPALQTAAIVGPIPDIGAEALAAEPNSHVIRVAGPLDIPRDAPASLNDYLSNPIILDLSFILFTVAQRLITLRLALTAYEGSNRHNRVCLPSVSFIYSKLLTHFTAHYTHSAVYPAILQTAMHLYEQHLPSSYDEREIPVGFLWRSILRDTLSELSGLPKGCQDLETFKVLFRDLNSACGVARRPKSFCVFFEKRPAEEGLFAVQENPGGVELYKMSGDALRGSLKWKDNLYIVGRGIFFACGQQLNKSLIYRIQELTTARFHVQSCSVNQDNARYKQKTLANDAGTLANIGEETKVKKRTFSNYGNPGDQLAFPDADALYQAVFGGDQGKMRGSIVVKYPERTALTDIVPDAEVSMIIGNSLSATGIAAAIFGDRSRERTPIAGPQRPQGTERKAVLHPENILDL
jgi:hypothetical protein